ncbi:MAG: hypothetical protein KGY80_04730 [Candidatus Thorarchaeota archaeon]|nr:hypothetical protein [Candidatus Thorarchaeota archaeon]
MPRRRKTRTWLMPQEVEVWYIIPAVRRELTRIMIDNGIAQKNIADMLGVTEPAVTQYKLEKSKRSRGDQVEIPPNVQAEIETSANRIHEAWLEKEEDEHVYELMTREINRIIDIMRDEGIICEIHREHCENVVEDCKACK